LKRPKVLAFWLLSGFFVLAPSGTSTWAQEPPQGRAPWVATLKPTIQASSNLEIHNYCKQTHSFSITREGVPFLQFLTNAYVTVGGHSSKTMPVRFDTTGMNPGDYQGTVVVKCETCSKEPATRIDRTSRSI